jgi:hypothetical protein
MNGEPGYRCLCASCQWRERKRLSKEGGHPSAELTEKSLQDFLATLKKHLVWLLKEQ